MIAPARQHPLLVHAMLHVTHAHSWCPSTQTCASLDDGFCISSAMQLPGECRKAFTSCRLASQAMAAAMAAGSAAMLPQSAGPPPVSQPLQQTVSTAEPATHALPLTAAPPAAAAAAPAAAEGAAPEPELEPTPQPQQQVKLESEPAKGEPSGWSGWSGWE